MWGEELTAQCTGQHVKAKGTWIPCLAVPRTALWQWTNPFTSVPISFTCSTSALSLGIDLCRSQGFSGASISQIFKWGWKHHPLAKSPLLRRLVQHLVRTSAGTVRGDHKSKNDDCNTITTIYIQALTGTRGTRNVRSNSSLLQLISASEQCRKPKQESI